MNAQNKSFLQKAAMWVRGNLFLPDPRCLWIGPSVRFLKKYLKEHPVDLIVSTGPPQSMHIIGMKLSKATGLPWIADFRDPWTKIFYFKHLSMTRLTERWHKRMERRCWTMRRPSSQYRRLSHRIRRGRCQKAYKKCYELQKTCILDNNSCSYRMYCC